MRVPEFKGKRTLLGQGPTAGAKSRETVKDQTRSSPLLGVLCPGPVHLDPPLPREREIASSLPDPSSTLSSAKTIYSQDKEELRLIAVTTCRDGLLMYLDTEQFASTLYRQTFPRTNVFIRPFL